LRSTRIQATLGVRSAAPILSIDAGHRVDAAINHMLDHGWSLLHVGSEWDRDQQGKSISHTVAILGTPRDS
jgi:hypothetical protein